MLCQPMNDKKKAFLIAGDYRNHEYSAKTLCNLIGSEDDVYVSVWNTTSRDFRKNYVDYRVTQLKKIDVTREMVEQNLQQFNIADITLEDYDSGKWISLGYNSNFIHRILEGIKQIIKSGIDYSCVTVLRPDLFFDNADEYKRAIDGIKDGEFVTIFSDTHRVEVNKTLNDMLFTVTLKDLGKVVPSIEEFQQYKRLDWHTFFCEFITRELRIVNVNMARPPTILRIPVSEDITYAGAIVNAQNWDNFNIYNQYKNEGLRNILNMWHVSQVARAFEEYKVNALIINGKYRNSESFKLCQHIFPHHEKYVIKWESDSCDIDGEAFVLSAGDDDGGELPFAQLRMYKLLEQLDNIPNVFNRYIIVRPDVFYMSSPTFKMSEFLDENKSDIITLSSEDKTVKIAQDVIFLCSRRGKNIIQNAFASMHDLYTRSGNAFNCHTALHEFLSSVNCAHQSDELCNNLIHIIQRDNITMAEDDSYDFQFATKLLTSSKEWWEKTYSTKFDDTIAFKRLGDWISDPIAQS